MHLQIGSYATKEVPPPELSQTWAIKMVRSGSVEGERGGGERGAEGSEWEPNEQQAINGQTFCGGQQLVSKIRKQFKLMLSTCWERKRGRERRRKRGRRRERGKERSKLVWAGGMFMFIK